MRAEVVRRLRCPVCGQSLSLAGSGPTDALRCPRGHSFDQARQGYVNLLAGRAPHVGDTAEMVAAREAFLAAGHYAPITDLLARTARAVLTEPVGNPGPPADDSGAGPPADDSGAGPPADDSGAEPAAYPDLVVDAGAGTGRYLAAVLDAAPRAVGLALDVAKPALRRAARVHPRAAAALADTWRPLPVADAAAALVLNVFAPRNGPEFRRILRPDGALLLLTPAADHLTELVERLRLLRVDPAKTDRVAASLAGDFTVVRRIPLRYPLRLDRDAVRTVVGMGPSAWHTDPDRLTAELDRLDEPVEVTVSVVLAQYRPH